MAEMDARLSLERLDVDNYATWSVRMRFALISKGLWKHVTNDGEVTDTDGDQKALALIGLSVMDYIFPARNLERGGARAAEALSQEPLTAAQPPSPRFWLNRQRLFPAFAVGFLCRANF